MMQAGKMTHLQCNGTFEILYILKMSHQTLEMFVFIQLALHLKPVGTFRSNSYTLFVSNAHSYEL